MGMDIYVGPLCRYYAHDWETPTARWAREQGIPHRTITSTGERKKESPREYQPVILGWRHLITPHLKAAGVPRVEWDERTNAPYMTSQFWPELRESLIVTAAYAQVPELTPPDALPEGDTREFFARDAAIAAMGSAYRDSLTPHLHRCEMWLPLKFPLPVEVETPPGLVRPVGSSLMLRSELAGLAKWLCVDPDDPAALAAEAKRTDTSRLRALAAGGLSVLWPLCRESVERSLPVLLDY
jgi:hypothetical protein